MSITDRFLLEFDEGLATVPENVTNISLELPRPGPNLHVSPDEAVIQARGRRRIPLSFSPERDMNLQVNMVQNLTKLGLNSPGKFFWIKCSHQDTSVWTANKKENLVKTDIIESTHCEKTA